MSLKLIVAVLITVISQIQVKGSSQYNNNCTLYNRHVARLPITLSNMLCNRENNIVPLKCIERIPIKLRDSVGLRLCRDVTSLYPAFCYLNLSTSNSIYRKNSDFILDFCKLTFQNENAALSCLTMASYIASQPKYKINKVLSRESEVFLSNSCQQAISEQGIKVCIQEMADLAFTKPQNGLEISLNEIIKACISSAENSFPSTGWYDESLNSNGEDTASYSFLNSSLSRCYNDSKRLKAHNGKVLSPSQRLRLCEATLSRRDNDSKSEGPVACMESVFSSYSSKSPLKSVQIETAVDVCRRAVDAGPAVCLIEAYTRVNKRQDEPLLIQLCYRSKGKYPVDCYDKVDSYLDKNDAINLCLGATSELRALCFLAAPSYLNTTERIDLCKYVGSNELSISLQKESSPVSCLQSLYLSCTKISSLLFIDRTYSFSATEAQNQQRASIINLCAETAIVSIAETDQTPQQSQPAAAVRSECLKRVVCDPRRAPYALPRLNTFEFVAAVCSQASMENAVAVVASCVSTLATHPATGPLDTGLAESVCMFIKSKYEIVFVRDCVATLLQSKVQFDHDIVASVCSHGGALALSATQCVAAAQRPILMALPSARLYISNTTLSRVCTSWPTSQESDVVLFPLQAHHDSIARGSCLADLTAASMTSGFVAIDEMASVYLCRYYPERLKPILQCLKHKYPHTQTQTNLDWRTIRVCATVDQEVSSVRVVRVVGQRGEPFVTAGEAFTIFFDVLDQFDQLMSLDHSLTAADQEESMYLSCDLKNDNSDSADAAAEYDAVIWGHKPSRVSVNGTVQVVLAISQPGTMRLIVTADHRKVTYSPSSSSSDVHQSDVFSRRMTLGIFKLVVRENPRRKFESNCLFIFYKGQCTLGSEASDTASNSLVSNFYSMTSCLEIFSNWGVSIRVNATSNEEVVRAYMLSYRKGIDAIWTGRGLPGEGMTAHEVLDLPPHAFPAASAAAAKPLNKTSFKSSERMLKKAYYDKSKLWHPDRWTTHSAYQSIVQSAFYYVHRAYESLVSDLSALKTVTDSDTSSGLSSDNTIYV